MSLAVPLPFPPYYRQQYGAAYLGDTLDLIGALPDNSVDLILTSPPFALTRKKEYGHARADCHSRPTHNLIEHAGAYLPHSHQSQTSCNLGFAHQRGSA